MTDRTEVPNPIRFGPFEVWSDTKKLRKNGTRLKLPTQAIEILLILLRNPGRVTTREELKQRLWPDVSCGDFDHGLNVAVNRLREALGDSSENPRFVETLPRRGYRFIGRITVNETDAAVAHNAEDRSTSRPGPAARTRALLGSAFLGVVILLAAGGLWIYKRRETPGAPTQRTLTRITFDEGLQNQATWSPDSRFIAYSSDRGGKFDIWVQQVSGGDPIQVTKGTGHHWQPDWSPDGKHIAYRSEEGDGGIYVVPALGGAGLERKIAPFGYYPRWSPDSSQVLLQTHFTDIDSCNRFYVAQLDGSPPHEVLAEFIAQNKLFPGSAAWCPDGKRITVWVGDFSPSPSFWTVPISGGPGIKVKIAPAVQKKLAEVSGEG